MVDKRVPIGVAALTLIGAVNKRAAVGAAVVTLVSAAALAYRRAEPEPPPVEEGAPEGSVSIEITPQWTLGRPEGVMPLISTPWYPLAVVEVEGKASKGATPMELTLEIYDDEVLVGSASEVGIELGKTYFISFILGGEEGNPSGYDLGEHTLQGRVILSNAEGSAVYVTESITIGISQYPFG